MWYTREPLTLTTARAPESSRVKISPFLSQMTYNWAWLLLLLSLVSVGMCLPTSLMEDVKKADQAMKPKCKSKRPPPPLEGEEFNR